MSVEGGPSVAETAMPSNLGFSVSLCGQSSVTCSLSTLFHQGLLDLAIVRLELTVVSGSTALLRLVREFAEGLGWTLASFAPSSITLREPDESPPERVLNLLTYVSLSAAKEGIDASEPLCRIRYREGPASEVTLGLRIIEFDIKT